MKNGSLGIGLIVTMVFLPLVVVAARPMIEVQNPTSQEEDSEAEFGTPPVVSPVNDITLDDSIRITTGRIQSILIHLNERKASIKSNSKLSDSLQKKLLEGVNKDIQYFLDRQKELDVAEVVEDVFLVANAIDDFLLSRRDRIQEINETIVASELEAKVRETQEKGKDIIKKLDVIIKKLEEKNIDTADLNVLVRRHEYGFKVLSTIDLADESEDLQPAMEDLHNQVGYIVENIEGLAKEYAKTVKE